MSRWCRNDTPTEGVSSRVSTRLDAYKAFVRAAATGDKRTAQRYVVPRFRANLGPGLERLDFRALMDELDRQRTAFPDLGQTART